MKKKRKSRSKGKSISAEAQHIARVFSACETMLRLHLDAPESAHRTRILNSVTSSIKTLFIPALLRRLDSCTLSEIDRARQKLRRDRSRDPMRSKNKRRVALRKAYVSLIDRSGKAPTLNELVGEACQNLGIAKPSDSLWRQLCRYAQWFPVVKQRRVKK